jgi:hypothetical protein
MVYGIVMVDAINPAVPPEQINILRALRRDADESPELWAFQLQLGEVQSDAGVKANLLSFVD